MSSACRITHGLNPARTYFATDFEERPSAQISRKTVTTRYGLSETALLAAEVRSTSGKPEISLVGKSGHFSYSGDTSFTGKASDQIACCGPLPDRTSGEMHMNDFSVPPKVLLIENANGYPIFPAYGLINKGYQIIKACHGYEALSLAQRHPDLLAAVIVEWDLRFMNGREIAARLRQICPTAQIVTVYPDRKWPFLAQSLPWLPSRRTSAGTVRTAAA